VIVIISAENTAHDSEKIERGAGQNETWKGQLWNRRRQAGHGIGLIWTALTCPQRRIAVKHL